MTVTRRPGVCGSNSFSVFFHSSCLESLWVQLFLCSSVFLYTEPNIPFDDLKFVVFLAYSFFVLSLIHMHNIHPGANIHRGCKFAPGVYFGHVYGVL